MGREIDMKGKLIAVLTLLIMLSAVSCGKSDIPVKETVTEAAPAAESVPEKAEEKAPRKARDNELDDAVLVERNETPAAETTAAAKPVTTIAKPEVKQEPSEAVSIDGIWEKVRIELCGKTYEGEKMDSYETLEINGDKGKYTLNTVGTDKKWDITVEKASDGRYRLKLDGKVTLFEPVINGDEMSYTLSNGPNTLTCFFKKSSDNVPELVPEPEEEDGFDEATEKEINGTWKKKAAESSDGSVYEEKDFIKGDIEVYVISGKAAKYTSGRKSWDFTVEKNEDGSYFLKMKGRLSFGKTYFDGDTMYYTIGVTEDDQTKFIFERQKDQ